VAPATSPSPFEHRLARAGREVRAVTAFLKQACGLLRQLVCLAVWLVLLTATARLLVQPSPDLGHLVAPGAGALAVLQGLPSTWAARRQRMLPRPPGDNPVPADNLIRAAQAA
jgi:hypothetical protein